MNDFPDTNKSSVERGTLSRWWRWLVAVLGVAAVFAVRILLWPALQEQAPLLLFIFAVMIAAWYGGLGPGLLATGLSALAGWFFFIPPYHQFIFDDPRDAVRLGLFALLGGVISYFSERLHKESRRAEASASAARGHESATRESEEKFRLLVEGVRDYAIFMMDTEGRITSWNLGAERLLGYKEEEVIGDKLHQIFTPEDRAGGKPELELRTALETGRADDKRWHVRKDGSRFWADGVVTAIRDEEGNLRGLSKLMRDNTALRQAEEELRESEARFRLIARATSDAVWDWNLVTDEVWWNDGVKTMFGYKAGEVDKDATWWYEHIHPEDRERVVAGIHQAIDNGTNWKDEYKYLRADGSYADIFDRGFVIRDETDRPVRMIGSMLDLTERKAAEAALFQNQELNQTILNSLTAHIAVLDTTGVIVAVNEAWQRFAVENSGDAPAPNMGVGTNYLSVCQNSSGETSDEAQTVAEGVAAVLKGEQPRFSLEYPCHSPNARRWFLMQVTPLAKAASGVVVSHINITERKMAEETQRVLRDRFKLVCDSADLGFWFCDLPFDKLMWDERVKEHFWLPPDAEVTIDTFYERLHTEDRERTRRAIERSISERNNYEIDYRTVAPDGRRERWVRAIGRTFYDPDGNPYRFDGVTIDVTEEKQAEAEREQLLTAEQSARGAAEQANRLKDEFLATVSHELRTPLTAILGWSRLLQDRQLDASVTQNALATIERNAQAQQQLIEDLMDVSRIITGKLRLDVRPVELVTVINAALEAVRPAAEAKAIRLQPVLDPVASAVSGDPNRLQQVVWNLLSNAIKFTPKGGRVQVRLERVNSHVEIAVSDTGQGISAEFLPYVFERFRQADASTTRAHGGLGLGLAIVRQLVEMHGGTARVASAGEGQGAIFTVKLPLMIVQPEKRDEERRHPKAVEGAKIECPPELDGVRVLVVDDEPDARQLLATILERCGAEVTLATSATEALRLLQELRPEVLLSDIGMPGEDGYSLIRNVRALPATQGGRTPAAALTAYASTEDRKRVLLAGFQLHIPKPVEPTELITVVASLAGRIGATNQEAGGRSRRQEQESEGRV